MAIVFCVMLVALIGLGALIMTAAQQGNLASPKVRCAAALAMWGTGLTMPGAPYLFRLSVGIIGFFMFPCIHDRWIPESLASHPDDGVG